MFPIFFLNSKVFICPDLYIVLKITPKKFSPGFFRLGVDCQSWQVKGKFDSFQKASCFDKWCGPPEGFLSALLVVSWRWSKEEIHVRKRNTRKGRNKLRPTQRRKANPSQVLAWHLKELIVNLKENPLCSFLNLSMPATGTPSTQALIGFRAVFPPFGSLLPNRYPSNINTPAFHSHK